MESGSTLFVDMVFCIIFSWRDMLFSWVFHPFKSKTNQAW
jgi:hypothetical protein